ncbi:DUF5388 domain-containing protein [Exiguobacterium aurantiacum]|uniref:Replication and copy control-associated protein n=1 Tax=Exiguobacterium aurantiacum TaxID=33987 RepID=A0A377HH47_9BACL|nr:DUF5388 domain-containing protein [Exiguobacterium aurantiacum]STO53302.1 Uncharacterised protein [Exiguobacterium aurantiacum]
MSDLIQKPAKKRLLDRKGAAAPQQTYKAEVTEENPDNSKTVSQKDTPNKRTAKATVNTGSSTVRVSNLTRNKLSALVTMGKGDSADAMIATMIDEYLNMLSSNERKEYEMIRNVLMMKQK